jgi:transposase-like protein
VAGRGKCYDEEFQKEAVRLLEAGRPAAQLARELGVSTWSLGQWKKRHGAGRAASAPVGRSPKGCVGHANKVRGSSPLWGR